MFVINRIIRRFRQMSLDKDMFLATVVLGIPCYREVFFFQKSGNFLFKEATELVARRI